MSKRSRRKRGRFVSRTTPAPNASASAHPTEAVASDENVAGHQIAKKLEHELAPVLGDAAKRGEVIEQVISIFEQEEYRGPLPHPEHFAEFERVAPGSGLRIIGMAETAARRAEDRYDLIVRNDHEYRKLGMNWAGVLLVAFLATGAGLIVFGHPELGASVLAFSGLTTVASLFIQGRKK